MKREILFRGQTITGEWVFGYYEFDEHLQIGLIRNGKGFVSEVMPETVGQFTGLTDKNGVKIFEGDIVRLHDDDIDEDMSTECFYWDEFCTFSFKNTFADLNFLSCDEMEVIGNIHDNPELLK